MPTVEQIVGVVLGTLPKLATFEGDAILAVQTGEQLYSALHGIFGSDVLPDKTPAEIATLAETSWDTLKVDLDAERARMATQDPTGG